ncbi:MAG: type I-E CRISPR-associated protein Cas6/Cse3/CasE [Gemmatimonadales bacterium]|nr:type I-E CRISPR-associated protein Cas6/Cse3/CasE [Gemmatimonadales bacterium]
MLLHRIHLNPRCREARRDLSDPYQMHSTLCRAFCLPDERCPEGAFLWRLEPEAGLDGLPRLLIQSRSQPDWTRVHPQDWLAETGPAIDLTTRMTPDSLRAGRRFRFRLRANPCVTRDHKRLGLLRLVEQEAWMARKGDLHGFIVPRLSRSAAAEALEPRFDVRVSQEQMLRGKQHAGNGIRVFAVLFDGVLTVSDPGKLMLALQTGIGHGKALGLGLLSLAPVAD